MSQIQFTKRESEFWRVSRQNSRPGLRSKQFQKLLKVVWRYVDGLMSSTVDFQIRRLRENWKEIRC